MICSSCGISTSGPAAKCPACGAAAKPPAAAAGGEAPGAGSAGFSFDPSRLSLAERVSGVATAVFLVALFLPWFGLRLGLASISIDAFGRSWMYLAAAIALAELAYLAMRAGLASVSPDLSLGGLPALAVASCTNLVLAVAAVLVKPGGFGIGWRFGAFLGVAAAAVAAAPWLARRPAWHKAPLQRSRDGQAVSRP